MRYQFGQLVAHLDPVGRPGEVLVRMVGLQEVSMCPIAVSNKTHGKQLTSSLLQVFHVGYQLFDKRVLAGDGVSACRGMRILGE
jgi:hypothetical protein